MLRSALSLLAAASAVAAQSQHTATGASDVAQAAATALTESPTSDVKGKAFDRLCIVWLENTDYDLASGDPNLAWLATKGVKLTNHFGVTHPSEPNYAAAIGGDYFGMNNDAFNGMDKNVSSVLDLLDTKGISWGEYQEDMPYSGFAGGGYVNQLNGKNDYVRKHNPAILYNNVASSDLRSARTKNLTMFYRDLEANKLPQWMFVTPNMTSDGHDTSVTVAGLWTRDFLEPLLNDKRFMKNTLVLVTFDENSSYAKQNRIVALLIGDAVPPALVGTTDGAYYNHYSEIASVSANWDLHTLGRWDVGANVWKMVADKTGDTVRPWAGKVPIGSMFWNQSYDGVFNSNPKNPTYPKPNLCIKRNGRTVLPAVKTTWKSSKNPTYYEDKVEIPDGLHPPAGYGF